MNESAAVAGVTTRSQLQNYYRWVEPDSDITVCLKLDTVERLQREVLRGLHSSSHAGNEVRGVLLGRREVDEGRTLAFVDDFEPVVLNFEAALERNAAGVVGYYRSHNRDGLFLSADDLGIIVRHFRRPDNVFLLIKTLPNRACTAGFFFWKDGRIESDFTDSEAPLIPISLSSTGPSSPFTEAAPVPPAAEPVQNRNYQRRLIGGIVVTALAAAVTFAVVRYRPVEPSAPPPVPVAVAKNAPPASTPVEENVAENVAEQAVARPVPPIPSAPKTIIPQVQNKPAAPVERSRAPEALPPAPLADARVPEPPVPSRDREGVPMGLRPTKGDEDAAVGPVGNRRPIVNRPFEPSSVSKEAVAAATPAQPAPVETTIAPPAAVTPPPVAEKPIAPPIETPRTPPPSSPPVPAPIHTFVGPQVIHQVTPAVPRGVGLMITTDVQVDVTVVIDANGKVSVARIASTKGTAAGLLTIEALKAAQLFRFQPAQENGRNVPSSMVLTFRFARTTK